MIVFASQVKPGQVIEPLHEALPMQIEVMHVEPYEHQGQRWVDITSKPKVGDVGLTAITVILTMLADATLRLVEVKPPGPDTENTGAEDRMRIL